MLDPHQLNIFVKASETLNFTQTAKLLHLTQPCVSQHIQSLENHFNQPLFLRNGSRLQLTEAGMVLVPIARDMVNYSIRIDEIMASLQGEIFGNINVGCTTTPGKYILPKFLALFHNQFPKVSVTCQVNTQAVAMEMLINGDLHFTLAGFEHIFNKDIENKKFICDRIQLIVSSDHPWAEAGKIQIDDLFSGKFIHRETDSGTFRTVQEALGSQGIDIDQLSALMTLGNSEAIALAVKESLGVGFVSESVIETLGYQGIQVIEIENLDIIREIFFNRNKQYPYSRAQIAFWEFLTNYKLENIGLEQKIIQTREANEIATPIA
jgi:DNA-binding transcriptional LysR family regulator